MMLLLNAGFSFCLFVTVASGSESNDQLKTLNQNQNQNSSQSPIEHLKGLVKYFEGVDERNQKQDKINEELKQQRRIIVELKEEVKNLTTKFEELETRISEDSGVWLLTPPLRGPPGFAAVQSITSCSVAMEALPSPRSKQQTFYPHGNTTKVEVLCDFEVDGGGWTIIQKRSRGPREEFNKTWNEYVKGFGSLNGNFWLGLENIHALTKIGDQELRIELEDFEGEKRWAKYSSFSISDALDFYRLSISGFHANSTAGDSMTNPSYSSYLTNGMRFTTKDKDNDPRSENCAVYWANFGGWWFNSECSVSNLNGLYLEKGEFPGAAYKGISWYSWKQFFVSLAKSEMKIRPRKP